VVSVDLSELDKIEKDGDFDTERLTAKFNALLKKLPDVEEKPRYVKGYRQITQKDKTDRFIEGEDWILSTIEGTRKTVTVKAKEKLIAHLRKIYANTAPAAPPSSGVPKASEPPSSGVPKTSEPPKPSTSVLFEPFSDVKIDNLQQKMAKINEAANLDNSVVSQARLQAAVVFKETTDRKALVFSQLKL